MLTQNNGRKMPIFVTPCILPSHTGFKNIFRNYRFLQEFPCVVIPPLDALAVYRVWRVKFHLNMYMHSIQELAFHIYIQVYGFITGFPLFFVKQQHGNLIKQFRHCAVSGIDFNKKKRIIWFHPFSGIDFHKSRNILISPVNRNRFPL